MLPDVEVPPTIIYEHATIRAISSYLDSMHAGSALNVAGVNGICAHLLEMIQGMSPDSVVHANEALRIADCLLLAHPGPPERELPPMIGAIP